MTTLRQATQRLAQQQPELRKYLVPLLRQAKSGPDPMGKPGLDTAWGHAVKQVRKVYEDLAKEAATNKDKRETSMFSGDVKRANEAWAKVKKAGFWTAVAKAGEAAKRGGKSDKVYVAFDKALSDLGQKMYRQKDRIESNESKYKPNFKTYWSGVGSYAAMGLKQVEKVEKLLAKWDKI